MGTRADFYIGRGTNAEWLGSTAWDGYPDGIEPQIRTPEPLLGGKMLPQKAGWPDNKSLFSATTEDEYKQRLELYFAGRDDATRPEQGWPWPCEDSKTTDYAYAFDDGAVWISGFGRRWITYDEWDQRQRDDDESPDLPKDAEFPNMKARQNVTLGSRSGVMVFGIK